MKEKAANSPKSLWNKAFRVILAGALLLILLFSAAGMALHTYFELLNYHDESRHLMDYTLSLLDKAYLEKIFSETKTIYDSLPEDLKDQPFSEEYIEKFQHLTDDAFYTAREILVKCREKTENRNMFLMMTDPERSGMIYIVDGDVAEWAYIPGQWIPTDLKEVRKIEESSWRLRITHEDDYGWIGTDYKCFADSKGNPLGYIVIDVNIDDLFRQIFRFLVALIPIAVLAVVLIALEAYRLLKTHILDHLTAMASTAKAYTARDKLADLGETPSYFSSLDIRTRDELEDLWQSMTDMEADVQDTMQRLRTMTAERERIEAELSIAARIQVGTLPRVFPAFPDRKEFDIFASMTPAREVGGDFYDFFFVDEDHLALVIADVSGKGISAALFMVNAKALLKNQTMLSGENVVEIAACVNNRLMEQNEAEMFMTAWLGILTVSTGRLVYVNAGHEFPAICRKGGAFEIVKDVHGAPMAAMENMRFRSGSWQLQSGDTIFVYTDGVTEAINAREELFGSERLLQALNREPDTAPQTLDAQVRREMAAFVAGEPTFDDTTMLCLKYYGPGGPSEAQQDPDPSGSREE
ncbi:MAG: PP2C family protein-serine/threonine phosphatase [Eubacterium sp.]|nr:PP2C family protein-serine/threonine phosphatase [Eubacterium sp.]